MATETEQMRDAIMDAIKIGEQLGGRHMRRSKRRNRRITNKTKRRRR